MRLRRLELVNVRRFGGRKARLGPFGDGLTTITAENEAGKSTFFDALHALLFIKYSALSKEARRLQPYSGGRVSVAAEIEIDGGKFRIEKTFIAGRSAKVMDCATGRILGQQDVAEAWIDDRINKANRGPAGLLWVRQGATHVDPQGRDRDAGNISARRDLMSSVRGQIDAVTGGRRMDKIVERCRRELGAMATQTLKARAGSPWKRALEKVKELQDREEHLRKDVEILARDLEVKRKVQKRLGELQDTERLAERKQQLDDATAALREAESRDQNVRDAQKTLELVKAGKDKWIREIRDITDMQDRRLRLADDISLKETEVAGAKSAQEEADKALRDAQTVIAEKETARRALVSSLKSAREAEHSRKRRNRLFELSKLLQQLEIPQKKLARTENVLKGPEVTQADLDRLADLARRASVAREQRRARFARFSVRSSGSDPAEIDGKPVQPGEESLIDRPIDLHVPGFGEVCLRPAEGSGMGIEDPKALQAEHDQVLQESGFETLKDARDVFNTRQRALNDRTVAVAQIRGLAPDGVAALDGEWQSLCAELEHPPDAPVSVPAASQSMEHSAEQIEAAIAGLDNELQEQRLAVDNLQSRLTMAADNLAESRGVLKLLLSQQKELAKPGDEDARLQEFTLARDEETKREDEAQQKFEQLKQDAPDLEAARSTHERLLAAEKGDHEEINRLERDLARANGAIETQSENAVEEKHAETGERLARETARADRYEMEAKALDMLIRHLEAARSNAQETYFKPIYEEIMPLLTQLYPGADFEIDSEKMLIDRIIRNGVEDDIDVLSAGAYEQIAILTRLAFARLFAKQGRHVPVILDDALVHTDDERIGTMFNMLSQVARDQQVIVLSCRTKTFSDLGGERAFIDTEAV